MANQALVPQGLPQGERQKMVAARRQAGLALDPAAPAAPTGPVNAPPPSGANGVTPRQFDPLLEMTPDMVPSTASPDTAAPTVATQTPQQFLVDLAGRSQSGLMRTFAARMAGGG